MYASPGGVTLLGGLLNAGTVLPLVWRRRWPFAVATIVSVFALLVSLHHRPGQTLQYGGLVAVYTLADLGRPWQRRSLTAGVLVVVVLGAWLVQDYTAPDFMFTLLLDGFDGQHGPGLAWTVGHTLFLAAMLLFGLATALVRQLVTTTTIARRVVADLGTAAAAVGLACFLKVIVIDLVVGLRAADRTAMDELFARYQDDPVALPAVLDDFGPALFIVGVAVLLTQLAMLHPRRLPGWSPAVFLAGALLIEVNLDLLPLGAILLGVALLPLARRGDRALAARPAPTTGPGRSPRG